MRRAVDRDRTIPPSIAIFAHICSMYICRAEYRAQDRHDFLTPYVQYKDYGCFEINNESTCIPTVMLTPNSQTAAAHNLTWIVVQWI